MLRKMSPLALKITKRALEEGSELTLAECLQMEKRMSQRFCADHDFPEGISWNPLISGTLFPQLPCYHTN